MSKNKLFRAGYAAIVLVVISGGYFFFNHVKRSSDLDDYYYEKLKKCHFTALHPCENMITSSCRDYAIEDHVKTTEEMLQDGYTRAEIDKMSQKALNTTIAEFNDLGDKFWNDLDAKYAPKNG